MRSLVSDPYTDMKCEGKAAVHVHQFRTTLPEYHCRNYTLQGKEQETGLILVVHLPITLPIVLSLSLSLWWIRRESLDFFFS